MVPGISKLPNSNIWLAILLALVVIMGCVLYCCQDSSRKSLSLPVLQQDLIGREEEMKIIFENFSESKVKLFTLYGQAGFDKSEIALHVGHEMLLEWGYDVHYIRVEDFQNVSSIEDELMEISGTSCTSKRLVRWAHKKTLIILDNVDGQYWVNDESRRKLKELFLNPLLEYTKLLQVR